MNKLPLYLFHRFPKPGNCNLKAWQNLKITNLELSDIEFLGATGSARNNNSMKGNYYFLINPIWIAEEKEEQTVMLNDRKAIITFKPTKEHLYLKHHIHHPDADIMANENPAYALINLQIGTTHNPNKIRPQHIKASFIEKLKNDIQFLLEDLTQLEFENSERGAKRACFKTNKGYFFLGICPIEYAFPPEDF